MTNLSHQTVALDFDRPTSDTLLVRLSGRWTIEAKPPPVSEMQRQFESSPSIGRIAFDTRDLTGWDSGLLIFLAKLIAEAEHRRIAIDRTGLPEGVGRLLALAAAVPTRKDTGPAGGRSLCLPVWGRGPWRRRGKRR